MFPQYIDAWVFLVEVRGTVPKLMTYRELYENDKHRLAVFAWENLLPMMYSTWDWTIEEDVFPLPDISEEDVDYNAMAPPPGYYVHREENLHTYIKLMRGEEVEMPYDKYIRLSDGPAKDGKGGPHRVKGK